jgi:glycine cleavage system H protein
MNAEVLKYTKNHVWVHVDGDKAVVGLSDYAQQELGDIVFVEMPQQGTKVKKDESMGTVESVKSVSDIFSPLAGEIVDFNKVLEDTPETINKDPFGEGWIVKIKIENAGEIDTLMDFAAYTKFTESER